MVICFQSVERDYWLEMVYIILRLVLQTDISQIYLSLIAQVTVVGTDVAHQQGIFFDLLFLFDIWWGHSKIINLFHHLKIMEEI